MLDDGALDIGAVVFMVLLAAEIGRSLFWRWALGNRVPDTSSPHPRRNE
jgi:hypothetical protein